jgi:RND family efflux transporter MFP subunit
MNTDRTVRRRAYGKTCAPSPFRLPVPLLAVLMIAAALPGCKRGADGKTAGERPAVSVTVAPVETREIQRSIEVTGAFRGLEEVTITPKVEGRIVKIYHDAGDIVEPGDVLMDIDPTDYKLAVEERSGELNSELQKIDLSEMPRGDFDIEKHIEQLPTVVRAANLTENMRRRLDRFAKLYEKKTVSEEDLQQMQTDLKVAEATVSQMRLEGRSTWATARQKSALLATARQRLEDTTIVAPTPTLETSRLLDKAAKVQYRVAQRNASEGEIVRLTGTTGLFKLVMDRPMKVLAAVPERYAGSVKEPSPDPRQPRQQVLVHVDAYPNEVFRGAIARVNPTVDPVSRTFQIEAQLPNADGRLKAGGFVKVDILTNIDASAKTVPITALVTYVGSVRVFAVRGGQAYKVDVAQGASGQGWVEVVGDLRPDDQVATSGQGQLALDKPTPIRIRETPKSEAEKSGND